MKILVLNGSPRTNGNTAAMVNAFAKGAKENGHTITVVPVCKRKLPDVLPANTATQREQANVFSRTICRRFILFWKKQRCLL